MKFWENKYCLFNLIEKFCFSYIIYFLGFLILLLDPFFYLILFFLTGIDLPINLLFSYSLDLIGFFLHISPLDSLVWSSKEILHYIDVREIFDKFMSVFVLCVAFLVVNLKKVNLKRLVFVKKYLKYIILFPLVVLPFFSYFWNNIFHKYLFSNDLWIMYPSDLSYHIFNEWFFILFYLSFILLEFLLFWIIDDKFRD